METHIFTRDSILPYNTAVALGNFDGVHLGHMALFDTVKLRARDKECRSVVWTFSSHTMNLLSGGMLPQICTLEQKSRLFETLGLDCAVYDDFARVQSMTPEEFICDVLIRQLRCCEVTVGFDFRFGIGGSGNAAFLRDYLAGKSIGVSVIDPVVYEGEVVSSTLIRTCILFGEIERANALLGRPFSIRLPVVQGRKLGRTIGVPTINQIFAKGLIIPARGVYVSYCEIDGRRYKGVSNVGVKPTVDGHELNCETHILDFGGDLYDRVVEVYFVKKLRDERKFDGVDQLKEQIKRDIETARAYD